MFSRRRHSAEVTILFIVISVLQLGDAVGEVPHRFVDNKKMTLGGRDQTTKTWTANEKQRVKIYFQKLEEIAPDLVRLINLGNDEMAPIDVVRIERSKRSLGFAKRTDERDRTYLVISDMFFRAYDKSHETVGYDGGNFTLWFFVHEMVHLAEYRSLTDPKSTRPTADPNRATFRVFNQKIEWAKVHLKEKGIDYSKYVVDTDPRSRIEIVRGLGLPTKYSLFNCQEALAETICATILSKNYKPSAEIKKAIEDFYSPIKGTP